MTSMKSTLLLVDVQNDFHPGGSLAIPSADEDAQKIASFIAKNTTAITRIVETMDTHHELHIAHAGFWVDANGSHPDPFTTINSDDITAGIWSPLECLTVKFGYEEVEGGVNKEIFDNDDV